MSAAELLGRIDTPDGAHVALRRLADGRHRLTVSAPSGEAVHVWLDAPQLRELAGLAAQLGAALPDPTAVMELARTMIAASAQTNQLFQQFLVTLAAGVKRGA